MKFFHCIFLVLFVSTLIFSCKSIERSVEITNLDCNYPVVLRFNPSKTKATLRVAYAIKITNKSSNNIRFNSSSINNGQSTLEYKPSGNDFLFIKNLSEDLNPLESQEFIIETRGRLLEDISQDPDFRTYLEQVENSSDNTLTVGTFKEFKEKHPQLLKKIAPNDTLKLGFTDLKSGDGFRMLHPLNR